MNKRCLSAFVLVVSLAASVRAHETDQFILPPHREYADLGDVFTRWAFDLLQRAVEKTNGEIRQALESNDQKRLDQLYSQDHIVRAVNGQFPWAMDVIEDLERTLHSDQSRARFPGLVVGHKALGGNVYSGAGLFFDPRQLIRLFYSSDFKAYGIHLGTDKVGHFTDMGMNYYKAWLDARQSGRNEEQARMNAIHLGTGDIVFSEKGFLGFVTAGSYSNGDLAANYLGFLFYRNLTEPMRIHGEIRPPMIVRDGPYLRLADHVSRDSDFFAAFFDEHLDESLNPSVFDGTIRPGIRHNVENNMGRILQRHADVHGNRRGKEYFDNLLESMQTYYGDYYGHMGNLEQFVAISNTCFGPINEDQDVAARDHLGQQPLHRAAMAGDVAAIKRLLARNADVNGRVISNEHYSSEWGNTPLMLAVRDGHDDAVAALIDAGADVNAVNDRGVSVLHRAIARPKLAELLISKGAKIDAADVLKQTPLHYCARDKQSQIASLLLDKGAKPDSPDHQGQSPLHLAAAARNSDAMKALLAHNARVDVADQFQLTPLHLAAAGKNPAVVQLLLDKHASTSARDEFARTPLHDAARSGSPQIVSLLLSASSDPSARDAYGTTPLHLACRRSRVAVAKLLTERGVDVNVHNSAGATPLHEAALVGDWPLVRFLLSKSADPKFANSKGETPLHVATAHRRFEVINVLQGESVQVAPPPPVVSAPTTRTAAGN